METEWSGAEYKNSNRKKSEIQNVKKTVRWKTSYKYEKKKKRENVEEKRVKGGIFIRYLQYNISDETSRNAFIVFIISYDRGNKVSCTCFSTRMYMLPPPLVHTCKWKHDGKPLIVFVHHPLNAWVLTFNCNVLYGILGFIQSDLLSSRLCLRE